jgi:MFS transporter, PAT family, beta-lactamase induction signal transducer AmpG
MPTLPGSRRPEPLERAPLLRLIFSPRMLVAFLMGFSCGLPLLLTGSVLQAWMSDAGVDLSLIGLLSLVGLPYTFKFLWAPFLDRYAPPVFGRRRGWLLISQLVLVVAIAGIGLSNPGKSPSIVILVAFWVCFFSASQDVVVDAYRREDLSDRELGLGSSLYVSGYRVGMLLAGGGGLILADHLSFSGVYFLMAGCMIPGMVTTLFAQEPPVSEGTPETLRRAVLDPLIEYFSRSGALWILLFIVLYKIGDVMASAMTTPFYLSLGYTKTQIGTVVKLFGFWATILGGLAGGVMMLRFGIYRGLWWFGILQALSTACFAMLARVEPSVSALAGVIAFENLSSGMGTAAFAAFLAGLTHKRYTATQYSLLSSIMGIPRVFAAASTGFLAEFTGWEFFFIICTLIAIPGLVLLKTMVKQINPH